MPEFIEDNLRVIIIAVFVAVALLQKILEAARNRKAQAGQAESAETEVERPARPMRGPYASPPVSVRIPRPPQAPPPRPYSTSSVAPSFDGDAELARQHEMEERLRKIREARGVTPSSPSPVAVSVPAARVVSARGVLHRRLRQPQELRRAFIAKEILDRPLAMR